MEEDPFIRAKAQQRTRPIYHSCDAAICGRVFCSFLALALQKELADRCHAAGIGSRRTPPSVLRDMGVMAAWLARTGSHLASGGADGVDTACAGGAPAGMAAKPVPALLDRRHAGQGGRFLAGRLTAM